MRIIFGSALLLAALVSAQDGKAEEPTGCATAATPVEITGCYGGLIAEAEAAMNRKIVLIKSLKPFLESPELDEKLDDSQLAFLEYRKRVCEGVLAFRAGTSRQYPETLACQLMLDRQRTAALNNLYNFSVP